jgi:hypothetical protein
MFIYWIIISAFVAMVDRLYWEIFRRILERIPPPKGDPWIQSIICAVGGALGALAITRLTGASDPFTTVTGGFIGGRLVGGIIATVRQ